MGMIIDFLDANFIPIVFLCLFAFLLWRIFKPY